MPPRTSKVASGLRYDHHSLRQVEILVRNSTEQRQLFIALHTKLGTGEVDQRTALLWWSFGWAIRESRNPERWAVTDEGRTVLMSWPPDIGASQQAPH